MIDYTFKYGYNLVMKLVMVVFISFTLTACDWLGTKGSRYIERPVIFHPEKPSPIQAGDIEWTVANKEKLQEIIDSIDSDDKRFAFFMLTPEDYEELGLTMQEIIRYIKHQNNIIEYYRRTIPNDIQKTTDKETEQ